MCNIDFEWIRNNNLLLYEYVRGSKLYGISRPNSDTDYGGVYIEPLDSLLGIIEFPEQVNDKTNDTTWYSLRKYARLLLGSNPNILESLYVPADKVVYKNPIFDLLLNNRDEFVTKKCFRSFFGYASTQIEKARSLKKRITNPMEGERKNCLDFIFYEHNGDTKKVVDFLRDNAMKQDFCGLTNLQGMYCLYAMYYDWGAHFRSLGINNFTKLQDYCVSGHDAFSKTIRGKLGTNYHEIWDHYKQPFHYRGLTDSTQVKLSSIPKGEIPIMNVSYNKDAFSSYCRQWKGYHDFELHHNEERFNLAKEKQYDRKNACHSARLLQMGIEIAQGKGVLIDRTNIDREFLLTIREGKVEYEDLLAFLEKKKGEMKEAMDQSTIKEEIDSEWFNSLIINLRKKFYERLPRK